MEQDDTPLPKFTLSQLLALQQMTHDALIGLDLDELTLADMTAAKVDGYIFTRDRMRSQAAQQAEYIKQFKATQDALNNKADALEERLLYVMSQGGVTSAEGELWRVRIGFRDSVSVMREPTPDDLAATPSLVRQKLEWSKTEIGKAIKTGLRLGFAAVVSKPHLQVRVQGNGSAKN